MSGIITPEMRAQFAVIDTGLQTQALLNSPLGKHLTMRAEDEVEAKVELLKRHDILADPEGAVRLQAEIWRAETFLYWLAEAINSGTQVMENMLADEKQAVGINGDPAGA